MQTFYNFIIKMLRCFMNKIMQNYFNILASSKNLTNFFIKHLILFLS